MVNQQLEELWRQMMMVDAEYELAEQGLNMAVEAHGFSSAEALAMVQRLDQLGNQLLKLDAEYTQLLREAKEARGEQQINL